MKEITEFRY